MDGRRVAHQGTGEDVKFVGNAVARGAQRRIDQELAAAVELERGFGRSVPWLMIWNMSPAWPSISEMTPSSLLKYSIRAIVVVSSCGRVVGGDDDAGIDDRVLGAAAEIAYAAG